MAYKDPIKRREMTAEWKRNNPEKLKAQRARYEKLHYQRLRLKDIGWTVAEYEAAKIIQNNCCAICLESFKKTPHADHDHTTGLRRELLCANCNWGLGMFKDRPDLLETAREYLKKFAISPVPPKDENQMGNWPVR